MRDLQDGWLFYDANVLPIIRSLLEVFPELGEVALDIGDLVGGGYIDADEKLSRQEERPICKRGPICSRLSSWLDYEAAHVDGGTSYLVKFLRAFAAARINREYRCDFRQ